ncbi:uncharacterized protein LOC118115375 isoform X1 [Hippoglossus stenolepis]|uniref:uncharacterized protein LOC118115375 isoform X1 n=1 Tax=Hippoglossus stenolepis TaxID=195615 RepID=UPI001FAE9EB0|nr:uncharacterized protein LOC118115375 isoform X1 [Hippoglossus stenolepis]
MQVVSRGRSLWIYTLIFTSLQLCLTEGQLSTASPCLPPPPPALDIYVRSKDTVVLTCKVPEGHHGVFFLLYRFREKVDSQDLQSGAGEAQFTLKVKEEDLGLFCCLFRDRRGCYSAFSPYLKLEHQNEDPPTRTIPTFPPPVLSVEPSSGVVKCGDVLSFSCSIPDLPPQSQARLGHTSASVAFLLLRTSESLGSTPVILQPRSGLVSSSEPQAGVFTVGPVKGGEDGEYTCFYQVTRKRRIMNSTVSNVVQVTVTADVLPLPTLVLHQQTDVWHLLCTGSPAYPGAVFSLYLADNELPVATHHTKVIQHQASFPVPVQDPLVVLYQCQYSVFLGKTWSNSQRSRPLSVIKGVPPPSSPGLSGVDWPMVLGSFSAVVLFLCSVVLVVVVAHRKVKAAAEKKKTREEAQFWTRVHAKDHVVDLTLRRSSFTSQECINGDTATASRSPLWNSLSTFTSPTH